MRPFGEVVLPSCRTNLFMLGSRQLGQLPQGDSVTSKLVGHDFLKVPQATQQPFEKALGHLLVTALLSKDVEDIAVPVDGSP